MITGDNKPGNINTNELAELSKECWLFIGIAIAILIIATAIILYMYFSNRHKVNSLQKLLKDDISDDERAIILKYRSLKTNDKDIIRDTLKSLSNNHDNTD